MFDSDSQRVLIFIISCCLFVFILIGFCILIVYRYKQKQQFYFKSIEELKVIHQNAILQSQIEIQEQTFQNISRELHDNVGQKLSLVKLGINTIVNSNSLEIGQQLISSSEVLGEAITDIRDLSRSMSSEQILANGLESAFRKEMNYFEKAGTCQINIATEGETFYQDKNVELVLFRIFQEALNNIVRHAKATIVDLKLSYNEAKFSLIIRDNGVGFLSDEILNPGIGLANIKKRASIIGGQCAISSSPNDGTTITIKIPAND